MTRRRAYIVEDSGVGAAPVNPVVCFRLVPEDEGKSVVQHLRGHPTLSMESFRGIPLAPYWGSTPSGPTSEQANEGSQVGVYTVLDGVDPVHVGERIDVVGGKFALGMLAAMAGVRARWGGRVRSMEFVRKLPDEGPPLQTVVEVE
jgi:hypothetical protein